MTTKKPVKKKGKPGRQRSSSSGGTEASKPVTDVLELGRYLVAELKLEEGRNTLAKWLAHHLAELIAESKRSQDRESRKEASDRAVETILKIWDHRTDLPGNANPIPPYRNILQVLSELNPAPDNSVAFHGRHRLANLYRRFPRLVRALLILDLPQTGKGSRAAREIVRKFLEPEERSLLVRIEFLGINEKSAKNDVASPEGQNSFTKVQQVANKLIDETIADLEALRQLPKGDKLAK